MDHGLKIPKQTSKVFKLYGRQHNNHDTYEIGLWASPIWAGFLPPASVKQILLEIGFSGELSLSDSSDPLLFGANSSLLNAENAHKKIEHINDLHR